MSFDPTIGVYALGFAISGSLYIVLRRRFEARSRATKAAAAEAGLLEPASLHPKIDPFEMSGLRRLYEGLSGGRHSRNDQWQS
jgi:hypothetical protein